LIAGGTFQDQNRKQCKGAHTKEAGRNDQETVGAAVAPGPLEMMRIGQTDRWSSMPLTNHPHNNDVVRQRLGD
jgi:hypothetical protein